MSRTRLDRLENRLAKAGKSRAARWQHYAVVTGSAVALATNTSLSGLGAVMIDATSDPSQITAPPPVAPPQNEALLRSVQLAMAGGDSRQFAAAAVLDGAQAVAQLQGPVISTHGVVPLYGSVNIIQPGGWVSIYGADLAAGTAVWGGDFPTSLGGVSVTINGKAGLSSSVSPGQINLQAPDDSTIGIAPVVVTTRRRYGDHHGGAAALFADFRLCWMPGMSRPSS